MWYVLLYALTGAAAGLVAGLLGVGGGIVNVPVLHAVFKHQGVENDLSFHLALGTSLAAIVFTAASACYAHHQQGEVDVRFGLRIGASGVLGSVVGSYLAAQLTSAVLEPFFGLLLVAAAIQLLVNKQPAQSKRLVDPRAAYGIGVAAGLLSGFFGVGGGVVAVPLMIWIARFEPARAVATSTLMIVILGAAGAVTYVATGWHSAAAVPWSFGFVHGLALLFLTPTSILTARYSAGWAHRLNPLWLKRMFAVMLLFVAADFLRAVFD
jgi:uncharacterized membrane protein YfcA